MPARSGGSPGRSISRSLTGRRCTTFTQFPLAFCGGRIANSAPVAGLMLSTSASQVMSGCMSSTTVAFWPTVTWVRSVSLKFASTQGRRSATSENSGVCAFTCSPGWSRKFTTMPARGALISV